MFLDNNGKIKNIALTIPPMIVESIKKFKEYNTTIIATCPDNKKPFNLPWIPLEIFDLILKVKNPNHFVSLN